MFSRVYSILALLLLYKNRVTAEVDIWSGVGNHGEWMKSAKKSPGFGLGLDLDDDEWTESRTLWNPYDLSPKPYAFQLTAEYGVEAWMCDTSNMVPTGSHNRTLPSVMRTGWPYGPPISIGAIITVCFAVNDMTYADGIRMKPQNFDWVSSEIEGDFFDYNFTDDCFVDNNYTSGDGGVKQSAIRKGRAAKDKDSLISYNPSKCNYTDWCSFESFLNVNFYKTTWVVYGYGEALLDYDDSEIEKALSTEGSGVQESTSVSFFDVSVDIEPDWNSIDWNSIGPFYWVEVYLCDPTKIERVGPRLLPKHLKPLPECYFEEGVTMPLCVVPQTNDENIVIANITDISWSDDSAKDNSKVADSILTTFWDSDCQGVDWCVLSTTLLTPYEREGQVSNLFGRGYVSLEFRNKSFVSEVETWIYITALKPKHEWFSKTQENCSAYFENPDSYERGSKFYKYHSTICANQATAFAECREMDKACVDCPVIDVNRYIDVYPATLAEMYLMTLPKAPLSSPEFCYYFGTDMCADYYDSKPCCCVDLMTEWQECLVTQDFPEMAERTLGLDRPETCGVYCLPSEPVAAIEPKFDSKTAINAGIAAVLIVIGILFIYLMRRRGSSTDVSNENRESKNISGPENSSTKKIQCVEESSNDVCNEKVDSEDAFKDKNTDDSNSRSITKKMQIVEESN